MTGLTHDERGYPSLTAERHNELVNRLVDKVRLNAPDILDYEEHLVDDADTVVIAYGCTARSAESAVRQAREDGLKVGLLRPKTIWPFPEDRVRRLLERGNVGRFVVPEINLGQLRREIERLTQLPTEGLNHAGGAMPTPEDILEVVRS
jgi:2-oxoglutarate ferredoxin oxidoreductase subunit alpha